MSEFYKPGKSIINLEAEMARPLEDKQKAVGAIFDTYASNYPLVRERLDFVAQPHIDGVYRVIIEASKFDEKINKIPVLNTQAGILMNQKKFVPTSNIVDIVTEMNRVLDAGKSLNLRSRLSDLSKQYPDVYGATFKTDISESLLDYKKLLNVLMNLPKDQTQLEDQLRKNLNGISNISLLDAQTKAKVTEMNLDITKTRMLLFIGAMFDDPELHDMLHQVGEDSYERVDNYLQILMDSVLNAHKEELEQKMEWDQISKETVKDRQLRDKQISEQEEKAQKKEKAGPEVYALHTLNQLVNKWQENKKNLNSFYRKNMIAKAQTVFGVVETNITEGKDSASVSSDIVAMLVSHQALEESLQEHPISTAELFIQYAEELLKDLEQGTKSSTERKAILAACNRVLITHNEKFSPELKSSLDNLRNQLINADILKVPQQKDIKQNRQGQQRVQTIQKPKKETPRPQSDQLNRKERRRLKFQDKQRPTFTDHKRTPKAQEKPQDDSNKTIAMLTGLRESFNIKERVNYLAGSIKDYFKSNELEWDDRFERCTIKSVESARDFGMNLRELKPNARGFGDRIIFLMHQGKVIAAERVQHSVLDNLGRMSDKIRYYQKFLRDYKESIEQ